MRSSSLSATGIDLRADIGKGASTRLELNADKGNINMTTLTYSITDPALRSPVDEWQPHGKQSKSSHEWWYVTAVPAGARSGSYPSRLCEKSVVQFACRTSVSVSSIRKPIALATSVGRRQLRKQFCASLAHATFHTAWV